jgi:large subunit ribosomal protein L18
MNKRLAKWRRAKRTRMRIKALEVMRLTVNKTSKHTYAQIMTSDGAKTLVCASTLDQTLRQTLSSTGNVEGAKAVGQLVAQRALAAGIRRVAFDRSGFAYHGRIQALADAAREAGLEF